MVADCTKNSELCKLITNNLLALKSSTLCNALKKIHQTKDSIIINDDNAYGKITLRPLFFRLRPWFLGIVHQKIEPESYIYDFSRLQQKRKSDISLSEDHNRLVRRKIDSID